MEFEPDKSFKHRSMAEAKINAHKLISTLTL